MPTRNQQQAACPRAHTAKSGLCSSTSSQTPALLSPNLHSFLLVLQTPTPPLRQCSGHGHAMIVCRIWRTQRLEAGSMPCPNYSMRARYYHTGKGRKRQKSGRLKQKQETNEWQPEFASLKDIWKFGLLYSTPHSPCLVSYPLLGSFSF